MTRVQTHTNNNRRCARCSRVRPHRALGLCPSCYAAARQVRSRVGRGGPVGGWAAPDWVVVERLSGSGTQLGNVVERRTAVATLTRMGLSASEIARRLGIAQRSVHRIRARAAA